MALARGYRCACVFCYHLHPHPLENRLASVELLTEVLIRRYITRTRCRPPSIRPSEQLVYATTRLVNQVCVIHGDGVGNCRCRTKIRPSSGHGSYYHNGEGVCVPVNVLRALPSVETSSRPTSSRSSKVERPPVGEPLTIHQIETPVHRCAYFLGPMSDDQSSQSSPGNTACVRARWHGRSVGRSSNWFRMEFNLSLSLSCCSLSHTFHIQQPHHPQHVPSCHCRWN